MSPALLLVVLLAAGQQRGGTGASDCWTSCQRHVANPATRARVCGACLSGGRVDAWVPAVGAQAGGRQALASARTDPDWRVRWAAVRADAKGRGLLDRRALADWVTDTPPSSDLAACLTAARAAADAGRSTADFLKEAGAKGPAAAARVWARRDAIRQALEVELYAPEAAARASALSHLGAFLGRSPARVVLDAMAQRPESGDAIVASALRAVAERQRASVGRMLLLEARQPDEARINRLFAVYSKDLEALQPDLVSGDVNRRRSAVATLRLYGPLARRELERAAEDDDARVREHAARGLADAEGQALREAATQRVSGAKTASAARPWLEAMAREKGCAAFLRDVAEDLGRPGDVRGQAVALLGDCAEARGDTRRLEGWLSDPAPAVRAGAVRALAASPRGAQGAQVASRALEDPAPEVVAAALEVVAERRQPAHGDDAAGLLGSEHPVVRAAAARALERIGRPPHVKALAACLREDPVVMVRVAVAQALATIGGPLAVAALSEAVARDGDTHVQHVSREGLRRLGFTR